MARAPEIPAPGGWAAILEYHGRARELSGNALETTKNRMDAWGLALRRFWRELGGVGPTVLFVSVCPS
jgi:ribonuclease HI